MREVNLLKKIPHYICMFCCCCGGFKRIHRNSEIHDITNVDIGNTMDHALSVRYYPVIYSL